MSVTITDGGKAAKAATVTIQKDLLIVLLFIGAVAFGIGVTFGIKIGETNQKHVMEAKRGHN